jgi:dGTPase
VEFDGLNLTWETQEGLVKHNGPQTGPLAVRKDWLLPGAITEYVARQDLELDTFASAEAQVAALADDVAYNNHDIEDGLRAGLFTLDDLKDVPLVGPVLSAVARDYPGIERPLHIHETVRRMIGMMIGDMIEETRRRLADFQPKSADDVRRLGQPLVAFSDEMKANDRALKEFLFPNMYRHFLVNRMTSKARRVVKDLFTLLHAEPGCLPPDWRRLTDGAGTSQTARVVADYIAGMTDRFALDEHRRLFDMQEKP